VSQTADKVKVSGLFLCRKEETKRQIWYNKR
jgi:hypothetical protein